MWGALASLLWSEHALIVAATFLFPPLLLVVSLVIILATFGKSLGLRQRYVDTLIYIFEWGARQIKTEAKAIRRKESSMLDVPAYYVADTSDEDSEEEEEDFHVEAPLQDEGLRKRRDSATSVSSTASSTRRRHGSGQSIIRRDAGLDLDDDADREYKVLVNSRGWAVIRDSMHFVKAGIEAIIEDEVTSRFEAEQLASWNMLTRTSTRYYQYVNWKLTLLWVIGWLFRYCVLLPLRFTLFGIGMVFLVVSTAVIGLVPDGAFKRHLNNKCMLICYRILSRSLSAVITFHDTENRAKGGGIAVANHTSPIDVMILSTDNVYALIGQRHGGFLGYVQRALSRASAHIWFERSEAKDRSLVADTMRKHVEDPNKLPILIFPEGTCINNTSVMMFKKGSFEIGATVYPIAMKYDSRFGDPFWNSSQQSMISYVMSMMTSWAIICQVWYLPPMTKMEGEDAVDFANRVKKLIAERGGLVDLEWDGQLKRSRVPLKLIEKQQEKYYHRMTRYTSTCDNKVNEGTTPDGLTLHSPTVSGYNSLEELPEDAVCTDSEEDDSGSVASFESELHNSQTMLHNRRRLRSSPTIH